MTSPGGQSRGLRPRRFNVLAFCLVLALLPFHAQADKAVDDSNSVKLEQLRDRISKLRQVLEKARSKKSKVQTDLRLMDESIGQINRKLRDMGISVGEQKEHLGSLYKQQKKLRSGLSQQRDLLASQVRASYVMGRQEQLKIVLNQGDPSTVQRALVYFDYLNRSRTLHIQDVIQQLKQLVQVERKIVNEKQRLEELLNSQAEKKQELQKSRTARRQILRTLSREIVSKDKQLVSMLQNEKALQEILRAVESLGDIPTRELEGKPFAERKGHLPWPASGRISEKFGSMRAAGGLRWSGVMIEARTGQDVFAVARGRVAFADWLRGYGLMVIIDHGDGYMSLYGHNQSMFKELGEWVEEGETIATVGSSGGQTRSQLFFELRHKGKPVDPSVWCRRTHGRNISLKR